MSKASEIKLYNKKCFILPFTKIGADYFTKHFRPDYCKWELVEHDGGYYLTDEILDNLKTIDGLNFNAISFAPVVKKVGTDLYIIQTHKDLEELLEKMIKLEYITSTTRLNREDLTYSEWDISLTQEGIIKFGDYLSYEARLRGSKLLYCKLSRDNMEDLKHSACLAEEGTYILCQFGAHTNLISVYTVSDQQYFFVLDSTGFLDPIPQTIIKSKYGVRYNYEPQIACNMIVDCLLDLNKNVVTHIEKRQRSAHGCSSFTSTDLMFLMRYPGLHAQILDHSKQSKDNNRLHLCDKLPPQLLLLWQSLTSLSSDARKDQIVSDLDGTNGTLAQIVQRHCNPSKSKNTYAQDLLAQYAQRTLMSSHILEDAFWEVDSEGFSSRLAQKHKMIGSVIFTNIASSLQLKTEYEPKIIDIVSRHKHVIAMFTDETFSWFNRTLADKLKKSQSAAGEKFDVTDALPVLITQTISEARNLSQNQQQASSACSTL